MTRSRTAIATGLVIAAPLAAMAWWYAMVMLNPALPVSDVANPATSAFDFAGTLARTLAFGELRGPIFAAATLVTAVLLATRVGREDLGGFGGLIAFVVLAPVIAGVLGLPAFLTRWAPLTPSLLIEWPLALALLILSSVVLWVPVGGIWMLLMRRRLIPGTSATTDAERAASQAILNAAARDHVGVDAVNLGNQGSGNLRNRG